MNRLWVKLTLAFLGASLAAIGLVAAISLRATGQQFRQYVVSSGSAGQQGWAQLLQEYYGEQGSWEGAGELLAQAGGAGLGPGRGRGAATGAGPSFAIAGADGLVLASRNGELVGQMLPHSVLDQGSPLVVDGIVAGILVNVRSAEIVLDPQGESFLRRVRQSLALAAVMAAVLSLLLGVLISRRLTAPLRRLAHAAEGIAEGDLSQQVEVSGRDEIGQLAGSFNAMSASLAANEISRKNLVADVSHELRTPLTVIQGNLQAVLDGVYPLDMTQIASLYDETLLLTRLVDDLHELSLADAGQLRLELSPSDPGEIVRAAVSGFGPAAGSAGVRLLSEIEPGLPLVSADTGRLAQVLHNLIRNAMQHTPDGGDITVRAALRNGQVLVTVSDTGAGIPPDDLQHVFDRFYRGDTPRRRAGGAGLGLAIAHQIVAAHGGTMSAANRPEGGADFSVSLPALPNPGSDPR